MPRYLLLGTLLIGVFFCGVGINKINITQASIGVFPLKISLVNKLGDNAAADFWQNILSLDAGKTFNESSLQVDLTKSNMTLIVVSEWEDLLSLSYGKLGGDLFRDASKFENDSFFTEMIVFGGNSATFTIIYRIGAQNKAKFDCVAKNFVEKIQNETPLVDGLHGKIDWEICSELGSGPIKLLAGSSLH